MAEKKYLEGFHGGNIKVAGQLGYWRTLSEEAGVIAGQLSEIDSLMNSANWLSEDGEGNIAIEARCPGHCLISEILHKKCLAMALREQARCNAIRLGTRVALFSNILAPEQKAATELDLKHMLGAFPPFN